MIRVNLLKNRVQDPAIASVGATEGGNETREALIKIAFILIFTLGLMMFESQNIRQLNEERARVQATVNDLQQQVTAKSKEVDGIKDIAQQAQELEDKLKVLKLLSKLRLREVKTLDFMQSSIPEKVWLKAITYASTKDHAEDGRFQFTGNAVNTEDLTEFVKRLEDSAYMDNVIVIKNAEVSGPKKAGGMRDFLFTAEVGGNK
jgi:Tfp pilus assembly protein PilN